MNSSRLYQHDSIFCHVPHLLCPVERTFLREYTGLRVPVEYDCENLREGLNRSAAMDWGGKGAHPYYSSVPDRWTHCHRHEATVRAYWHWSEPQLPVVDEEYDEHVVLLSALVRAHAANQTEFYIVEAGARWGTWGFRATALAKWISNGGMRVHSVFFEPDPRSCAGVRTVAESNNFTDYTLVCDFFSTSRFLNVTSSFPRIDYFDMDIQGAERAMCSDATLISDVATRVRTLKIGVHFEKSAMSSWHECVRSKLPGFIEHAFENANAHVFHIKNTFRLHKDWEQMRQKHYFVQTPQGPIANWDGNILLQANSSSGGDGNREPHAGGIQGRERAQ